MPAAPAEPELLGIGRRWALACARRTSAQDALEAAEERLADVPVPAALRYRPGRDRNLFSLQFDPEEHLFEQDGARYFTAEWIEALRREQQMGIGWATPGLAKNEHVHARTLAARGAEVFRRRRAIRGHAGRCANSDAIRPPIPI